MCLTAYIGHVRVLPQPLDLTVCFGMPTPLPPRAPYTIDFKYIRNAVASRHFNLASMKMVIIWYLVPGTYHNMCTLSLLRPFQHVPNITLTNLGTSPLHETRKTSTAEALEIANKASIPPSKYGDAYYVLFLRVQLNQSAGVN